MTTREKVDEIEKTFNVASIHVNKFGKTFEIYPWLKGRLFHKMITGSETMQSRNLKLYWKQFMSIFYGVHNIFRRYEVWAFTTSSERREVEGKYHDKIVDFIGNETGYKTLVIEQRLFQYIPYRKIASKYALSRSFFLVFEELYKRLFLGKVKVENEELMQKVIDEIAGGVDHSGIIKKYLAQYKLMKFWLKLLPKPKAVFISVAYTNFGYIRAFHEAGIKVVEVQHGIITKNHHAYYYHTEFNKIQFPEYLITVGEKEVKVFDNENAYPIKNVVPLGSWIIDHYKDYPKKSSEKPTILFAMQDGVMSELFLRFILDLKKKIEDKYKIVVQPRRNRKEAFLVEFPELIDVAFSTKHFYAAVREADIHCTVYSTTAIESLSLGVPNILVNIQNQSEEQLGAILGENPFTYIVDTVDEFVDVLHGLKEVDASSVASSNDFNIKSGYKANAMKFVKELMDA